MICLFHFFYLQLLRLVESEQNPVNWKGLDLGVALFFQFLTVNTVMNFMFNKYLCILAIYLIHIKNLELIIRITES